MRGAQDSVASNRPHIFLGSLDRVLEAMASHLAVHTVIAPRGRLRNFRLERRLRDSGTRWLEIDDTAGFLEAVNAFATPGCCAVAGFSWRIRQDLIDRSHLVVNFHTGDICRVRGPQPLESGLVAGCEHFGVSVHQIDSEAMDAGPLFARRLLAVDESQGFAWHRQQLNTLCAEAADEFFRHLVAGDLPVPESWDLEASHWFERLDEPVRKKLYTAPSLAHFREQVGSMDSRV